MTLKKQMDQIAQRIKEQKIGQHLKDHWKYYAIGLGGVGVGLVASNRIQVANSFNIIFKSQVNQIAIQSLARRGHPGSVTQCVETGERAASINRMAEIMSLPATSIKNQLAGRTPDVKGYTFKILGEAVA